MALHTKVARTGVPGPGFVRVQQGPQNTRDRSLSDPDTTVSDRRTATFAWVGTEGLKAPQAFDTLSIAKHLHQPQASHRSGRPGRREHSQAPKGRTRHHPAPTRAWPNTPQAKDRWWRGKGPVRSNGFSRSRTMGRGRHIWRPEPQEHRTTHGAQSLRIADCRSAYSWWAARWGQSSPIFSGVVPEGRSSISMRWPSLATLVRR